MLTELRHTLPVKQQLSGEIARLGKLKDEHPNSPAIVHQWDRVVTALHLIQIAEQLVEGTPTDRLVDGLERLQVLLRTKGN